MFLNQTLTVKNYFSLLESSYNKIFDSNVWNRKRAMFHASFSDCTRNYIGMNKDHWLTPSKVFSSVSNTTEFRIRFSTDGINHFLPLYCSFIIELIYILNINNVEINR